MRPIIKLEKDNDIEKLEKTNDVLKDRNEMTVDEVTKLEKQNKDLKKQLNELNDKYTQETEM